VNPEKRLGCGLGGIAEIKQHRWFSRIAWDSLAARTLPAPIRPRLTSLLDTSNFDSFDDVEGEAAAAIAATATATSAFGGMEGSGSAKPSHNWDSWGWVSGLPVAAAAVQAPVSTSLGGSSSGTGA
jgi:hypothetical protein